MNSRGSGAARSEMVLSRLVPRLHLLVGDSQYGLRGSQGCLSVLSWASQPSVRNAASGSSVTAADVSTADVPAALVLDVRAALVLWAAGRVHCCAGCPRLGRSEGARVVRDDV